MKHQTRQKATIIILGSLVAISACALERQEHSNASDVINAVEATRLLRDLEALLANPDRRPETLEDLLSPQLRGEERARSMALANREFLAVKIYGLKANDLMLKDANKAEVSVRVRWETPRSSYDGSQTVAFERVDGKWYFAHYEFLKFPWTLFSWLMGAALLYTAIAVTLLVQWRRQVYPNTATRLVWLLMVFIPLGWPPYLIRRIRQRTEKGTVNPHR